MNNVTLREALEQVAKKGNFSFSYSEKTFNAAEKVSFTYTGKSVRYILNRIFNGRVAYKTRGEYIILLANGSPAHRSSRSMNETWINGYITDSVTHKKIPGATVYDSLTLASANTNTYGYFSLRFTAGAGAAHLRISKEGYENTGLTVPKNRFASVEIYLKPALPHRGDTMTPIRPYPLYSQGMPVYGRAPLYVPGKMKGISFLLGAGMKSNLKNVTDKIFRKTQLSLLPGIGTNRLIGGNVVNDYSVNIIAGYTLGINKTEIGGFMNIDRGNVRYLQGAGFANIVGGNVSGVQLAGFMNIAGDTAAALQGAGFMNICGGYMNGLQASGFYNQSGSVKGIQAAGFANIATGLCQGLQGAGAVNYSKTGKGIQIAGFCNITRHDFEGAQLAGFCNVAGNLKKGIQLAPFNFADSCEGIPIGFFDFVTHGYHKIEISADEIFYTNLAFRTGVKKFHNIFNAGFQPGRQTNPVYTLGYGVGTTLALHKQLDMDIDLITNMALQGGFSDHLYYNKIYVGIDWQAFRKVSFAMGPAFNFYIAQSGDAYWPGQAGSVSPSYLVDKNIYASDYLRGWAGGKIAIRFL